MINDELLHKWIEGSLTPKEQEIFEARPEYDSLTQLYKATENFSTPKFDENSTLKTILESKSKASVKVVSFTSYFKYAAAAAVLFIAGWFLINPGSGIVSHKVAANEKLEGSLPDQSTFILNAGSSLSYNEKDWGEARNLTLEGEAFFDVVKGSNFEVETANGSVRVLGTQFNVRSRGNELEVLCQSGKVAVLDKSGNVLKELLPTEGIRINDGKTPETISDVSEEKPSWISGISKFKNVPLQTVIEELERQYNIRISTKNINVQEIITCNFQHNDLPLALKTAFGSLEIETVIDGKVVRLEGK